MKRLALSIAALLICVPSVSFAAPLTQTQAESLINVVKASPKTPASTFTSLITAFSNITSSQAVSLIGVVQASPSAPTNSFVSLLIAFTQGGSSSLPTSSVSPVLIQPVTPAPTISDITLTVDASTVGAANTYSAQLLFAVDPPAYSYVTLVPTNFSVPGAQTLTYYPYVQYAQHTNVKLAALLKNVKYTYTIYAEASAQTATSTGTINPLVQ